VSYIIGKLSMTTTTLLQTSPQSKFTQKIMALQSVENPNFGSFRTPNLGVPRQNDIWMQPPWLIIEDTIRGKVVAAPKFEPW